MSLKLPPKDAPPTPENVKALDDGLTSVLAGHVGSIFPWTFYEELDTYLGPWGNQGYLIRYGRKYCLLFNQNENLQADPEGAEWVKQTTRALQAPLKDFVVARFKQHRLASLTEPELKAFAFGVHSKAYSDSGLAMVALVAPELIFVIGGIPGREFLRTSPDHDASWDQFYETMARVLVSTTSIGLAAFMPAHSGLLRHAAEKDMTAEIRDFRIVRWLSQTEKTLATGRLDNISMLNKLTERLSRTQFTDQGMARQAREVLNAANLRKSKVARSYRKMIAVDSTLKADIDKSEPGWSQW